MKANKIGKILSITSFENPLIKKTNFYQKKNLEIFITNFLQKVNFFLMKQLKLNGRYIMFCLILQKNRPLKNNKNLQKLLNAGTKIIFVSREIIKKITKKDNPQDFLFVVERKNSNCQRKI